MDRKKVTENYPRSANKIISATQYGVQKIP